MDDKRPFALLETWTCYGQWLPGDPRGYVSNTLTEEGYRAKRNVPGTAYDRDERATHRLAKALQKHPTTWLTPELAMVAAEGLLGAAVDREWMILRAAVMSNHVHVVVAECPDDGSTVRRVLKGVSQVALNAYVGKPCSWWTHGGSDRYLHGERAILAAVNYVTRQERMLAAVENNQIVAI
jgi:REP element-mobilizing transposase RayT